MKRAQSVLCALAAGLFAGGFHGHAQPIVIGYTNCLAVTNFSPAMMNQIASPSWYFAHASVGALMMEGITNLYSSNALFYGLQSLSATNLPAGPTTNGIIYHDNRGHVTSNDFYGDWQYSVEYFQTAVSNGWHYPNVNLAMNLFSFVNIWYNNTTNGAAELLNGYVSSMTNLEAAYPQTIFVYATMPITTTNYVFEVNVEPLDEYWRDYYNDSLRAWCRTNNKVLFDIADMEAHDTNGNLCTFIYSNTVCEQLWFGDNQGGDACCSEIGDGAHPTNFGVELLMARGLYALVAALAQRNSMTVLTSSRQPSVIAHPVTFTATVSGLSGTPTGTVQLLTNGIAVGGPAALTNGQAIFNTANLAPGINSVLAVYNGGVGFAASSNAIAQVVAPWGGTIAVGAASGSQVTLNCFGVAGFSHEVQRATNLNSVWKTLMITNAPPGGIFQWVDNFADLPAAPAAAYYRLKQPLVPWGGTITLANVSGGPATLNCVGIPTLGYQVLRATNLNFVWTTLLTTNAPAGGAFQWVDNFGDLPAVPARAYYRLKQL